MRKLRKRLTERQKRYALQCLACGDTPQQVADAVKAEFGICISRQSVEFYDPRKNLYLLARHRDTFEMAHAYYLKWSKEQLLNCLAYRQRQRMKLLNACDGNYRLQLKILDSAGNDERGLFVKKRGPYNKKR